MHHSKILDGWPWPSFQVHNRLFRSCVPCVQLYHIYNGSILKCTYWLFQQDHDWEFFISGHNLLFKVNDSHLVYSFNDKSSFGQHISFQIYYWCITKTSWRGVIPQWPWTYISISQMAMVEFDFGMIQLQKSKMGYSKLARWCYWRPLWIWSFTNDLDQPFNATSGVL